MSGVRGGQPESSSNFRRTFGRSTAINSGAVIVSNSQSSSDPENSDKIKRNLAILKESRLNKLFVTFNGRDVKAPAKEFKDSLIATFGNIGYDVYQMMNRLIWVSKLN